MDDHERLTDALLDASRALVAVAARSLADVADRLTLPEFRALVVLRRTGPLPVTVLAEHVGVHQSTATRIAARLQRRDLVATDKSEHDRRLTVVRITPGGGAMVDEVFARRRADIAAVVARLRDADVLQAHAALQAFAEELHGTPGIETRATTWAL
ncbi:MAG TPA: MarR family transcriptional regulator [Kineosporiaceae bacterium]|jgi:DNA-binding MarR family transcriptional regulator|nr:MarR family transcriptional regulator [Kineosporiaceae bacterium]